MLLPRCLLIVHRIRVTKSDGTIVTANSLKVGDVIVSATAEGQLTTDTVSLFSIAQPEEQATFSNLTTSTGAVLLLTPEHHLPVGKSCCSILKQAKDVEVGELVWQVTSGVKASATSVVKKSYAKGKGLHSPVLTNGGFPVVDGIITSFDSIGKVTLAKYGLAPLLKTCKMIGLCENLRNLFSHAA